MHTKPYDSEPILHFEGECFSSPQSMAKGLLHNRLPFAKKRDSLGITFSIYLSACWCNLQHNSLWSPYVQSVLLPLSCASLRRQTATQSSARTMKSLLLTLSLYIYIYWLYVIGKDSGVKSESVMLLPHGPPVLSPLAHSHPFKYSIIYMQSRATLMSARYQRDTWICGCMHKALHSFPT